MKRRTLKHPLSVSGLSGGFSLGSFSSGSPPVPACHKRKAFPAGPRLLHRPRLPRYKTQIPRSPALRFVLPRRVPSFSAAPCPFSRTIDQRVSFFRQAGNNPAFFHPLQFPSISSPDSFLGRIDYIVDLAFPKEAEYHRPSEGSSSPGEPPIIGEVIVPFLFGVPFFHSPPGADRPFSDTNFTCTECWTVFPHILTPSRSFFPPQAALSKAA